MEKFKTTEQVVKELLKSDFVLRDDDELLWFFTCETIYQQKTGQIIKCSAFNFVHSMRKENGLPSYATVSRCRRKLQAEHPELRGVTYTKRHTHDEALYEEYSRSI